MNARVAQLAAHLDAINEWPEPVPLPDGLPDVMKFDPELLPDSLRAWIVDIADRMQCPMDFPAVAAMVVVSSLVGRRVGIAPKRSDDWIVVPNLWGGPVASPGLLKTPALNEVMKPLKQLQAAAMARFDADKAEAAARQIVNEQLSRVFKDQIKKAVRDGRNAEASEQAERIARLEQEKPPACRRYIVNDSTVEKLGELQNENPNGLLLFRDELAGFFRNLEKQGHEADRAYYLECWAGDGSFTYDRIGRGTLHIEGACLSILGGIQPGPLASLVRDMRGTGDDGLLQRFQLLVWPDAPRTWRNVDRAPDYAARARVEAVINRLDRITAENVGADPGRIPVLRFDDDAQQLFDSWRQTLEQRLRSGAEHPMLEAHLAKFRSLVPSLALLCHLCDNVDGPVGETALLRAIAWAEYLESHARRIYAPAINPDMDAARLLLARIKKAELPSHFSPRDVYRNQWSGLTEPKQVEAAIRVLSDFDWIRTRTEPTAGRPRLVIEINPHVLRP
jgi:putative DNA primase/helicase